MSEPVSDAPITISDDPATITRFSELGIEIPTASVLPRNFVVAKSAEDFVFEQMTSTIRTLGRQAGFAIDVPGPSSYHAIFEKDSEIVAPVLLFTHAFLVEGGATLTVAFFEHLAHYVASRWGQKKSRECAVELNVVVINGDRAKRLRYRGAVDGLPHIVEIARAAFSGNDDDR